MSYYTVLELTNVLIAHRQWTLQRCRRRCDGPARYIVRDKNKNLVLIDPSHKGRRLGFVLEEVLMRLAERDDDDLAREARQLLMQLSSVGGDDLSN